MPLEKAHQKMEEGLKDLDPLEEEEEKTKRREIQEEIEKDERNQKRIKEALERRTGTESKATLLYESVKLLRRIRTKIDEDGLRQKINQRINLVEQKLNLDLFHRAYTKYVDGIDRTKYKGTLRHLMEDERDVIDNIIDFTLGHTSVSTTSPGEEEVEVIE